MSVATTMAPAARATRWAQTSTGEGPTPGADGKELYNVTYQPAANNRKIYGLSGVFQVASSASTDATLSALELKDADDNAITLSPVFASGTRSYTASVANTVARITVDATENDDGRRMDRTLLRRQRHDAHRRRLRQLERLPGRPRRRRQHHQGQGHRRGRHGHRDLLGGR